MSLLELLNKFKKSKNYILQFNNVCIVKTFILPTDIYGLLDYIQI